jgi:hypothetical protein
MRFTTTIASAAVAAVLGIAGVSVAGAASNTGSSTASSSAATTATTAAPSATPKAKSPAARKARRIARRQHIRRQAATLAAKTIGITRPDLVSELRSGKTIAAIATEHGVAPQTVIDAIEAAGQSKIDAAQAAHKITAERAAKLKTRLDRAVPRIVNTWLPHHKTAG